MAGRVVVVGPIRVSVLAEVSRLPQAGEWVDAADPLRWVGGSGASTAVAARAARVPVALVGCVGDDEAGRACRQMVKAAEVDVTGVQVDPTRPTGHTLTWVDPQGRRAGMRVAGADAALDVALVDARLDGLSELDIVVLTAGVPADVLVAATRRAHDRQCRVVLTMAQYLRLPEDVLNRADPVVVAEPEALLLADGPAVPGSMLVLFGTAGAAWDGVPYPATGPEAEVVDPDGVLEAFAGALAAGLLRAGAEPASELRGDADLARREVAVDGALRAAARARGHLGSIPRARL